MRLIDADALLLAYDAAHKGPPGGARKLIEEALTIAAIPVEWLQKRRNMYLAVIDDNSLFVAALLNDLICEWREEQKAATGESPKGVL